MNFLKKKEIVVMHCLTGIYDGGQETFLVKTFKYIQQNSENSFRFIICSLCEIENQLLVSEYEKNDIKLIAFNFSNRLNKITDIYKNFIEGFKLAKRIKREKVDILYGHDFFSALIVRIVFLQTFFCRLYRVKKIYISLHNLLFWLNKWHHIINKYLSYFTDKIVCVSKSVYDYSRKFDKIAPNKYQIIYNGIDVNEFKYSLKNRNNMRNEYKINEDSFIIGTVGSISFRKGHIYLVKAFKDFLNENPNSLLMIFGGYRQVDKESIVKEEFEKTIEGLNLNPFVRVFTPRLDINKIYSMFDVFVMPSVVEGFGLALVEAMASENIVIASDIPPFKEIITDEINGLLFESKNYMDLSYHLNQVTKMENSRKNEIRKSARQEVINRFNSNLMGAQYAKIYNI